MSVTGKATIRLLPLASIRPSPGNPRKNFETAALEELAASIREVGVIQPIMVTPPKKQGGSYTIVAGERRWRAAQLANVAKIPAIIRDLSPQETAKIAFIENLQRRDLDPIEEAHALRELQETMQAEASDVAEVLGKSTSYVYGRLRLLDLPEAVQREVSQGRL